MTSLYLSNNGQSLTSNGFGSHYRKSTRLNGDGLIPKVPVAGRKELMEREGTKDRRGRALSTVAPLKPISSEVKGLNTDSALL